MLDLGLKRFIYYLDSVPHGMLRNSSGMTQVPANPIDCRVQQSGIFNPFNQNASKNTSYFQVYTNEKTLLFGYTEDMSQGDLHHNIAWVVVNNLVTNLTNISSGWQFVNPDLIFTSTFKNDTTEDIKINLILYGICQGEQPGIKSNQLAVLGFTGQVLPEPIVIKPGEIKTISYTISYNE